MPDNPKTVEPVVPAKTRREPRDEHRDPSVFNEPDYPDNAADEITPHDGAADDTDGASGFDDRRPSPDRSDVNSGHAGLSNIHKY